MTQQQGDFNRFSRTRLLCTYISHKIELRLALAPHIRIAGLVEFLCFYCNGSEITKKIVKPPIKRLNRYLDKNTRCNQAIINLCFSSRNSNLHKFYVSVLKHVLISFSNAYPVAFSWLFPLLIRRFFSFKFH